jgi:glycosyltransferase involved in cell wall biosynthesis
MATVQIRQPAWVALSPHQVSVVVPAWNEAENLSHVLPNIPSWVHEVILVDGYSTDDTVAVAQKLLPEIRVVMQEGKGKGAALRTGFKAATGEIIVMLDADGSMDPREIPAYVGLLLAGADLVKGSRFLQGGGTADMPWYRRLGNQVFTTMVHVLFGGRYSDLCYGYSAFWKSALSSLRLDGDGFEIETMINVRALQAKLKVAEVPSFEALRIHGVGKLKTFPDGWRVLKTIWREWARPTAIEPAILQPDADNLRSRVVNLSTFSAVGTSFDPIELKGSLSSRKSARLREQLHYGHALSTGPESIEETRRHCRSYGACTRKHYRRVGSCREPHSAGEVARYLMQGMN